MNSRLRALAVAASAVIACALAPACTRSTPPPAPVEARTPCQAEGVFDLDAASALILARRAAVAECVGKTPGAQPGATTVVMLKFKNEPNETATDGRQRSSNWSLSLRPTEETKACFDALVAELAADATLDPPGLGFVRCEMDVTSP